jgi:hypothetical protein
MILTPQELLAISQRTRDYNDLMLEFSGLAAGVIPRFLSPAQIEKIREAAGLPSSGTGETGAERAWGQYVELTEQGSWPMSIAPSNGRSSNPNAVCRPRRRPLERIRERATVDGKGRRVYRTEDRQTGFTEDGEQLSPEEVQSIHWDPKAPTWEQHQAAVDRLREAKEAHESILRAKERADYYSQRMGSGEVPPSPSTPAERLALWCDRLPSPAPEMLRALAAQGGA